MGKILISLSSYLPAHSEFVLKETMESTINEKTDKLITRKLRSSAVSVVQSISRAWIEFPELCAGCAVYRALCVKPLQLHHAEAAHVSRLSSGASRTEGEQ